MNLVETSQLIAILHAVFPAVSGDGVVTAKVWAGVLYDIPADVAQAAAYKFLRSKERFAPTPGQIREVSKEIMRDTNLIENMSPTAEEAWENVMANMNPYETHTWIHPLVKKTVQLIGYRNLVASENLSVERAHFFKMYDNLRNRKVSEVENRKVLELVKKIGGGTDAKNRIK